VLLARTVGLGEVLVVLVIVAVVLMGVVAFRNRTHTDGDV
jgi:Na+-transporting methylmalonyl-CoA/oxaloacetate decarboxylase gamma subunit